MNSRLRINLPSLLVFFTSVLLSSFGNIFSQIDLATSTVDVSCYGENNGSISVSIAGGTAPFHIEWSGIQYDGLLTSGSDYNIDLNYILNNFAAGDYSITISDSEGYTIIKNVYIGQPNELTTVNIITDISCHGGFNGSIELFVSQEGMDVSNYPIYWTGPSGYSLNGTIQTSSTLNNLSNVGIYTATIFYNGSCSYSESFVITEPEEIIIESYSITNTTCHNGNDGSIEIQNFGGIPPYNFYWNTINGSGIETNNKNQYNLTAGTYSISVIDDNGCTTSKTFHIGEPVPINYDLDISHTYCDGNNGEIKISNTQGGIGPYSYSIDAGLSWQYSPTFTGLFSENYSIIVKDANSCISVQQTTLSEPETAVASGPSEVCGYSALLNANAPIYGTGIWSVLEGSGIFEDALDPNTRVNDISEGQNIFRWTIIGDECTKHADVAVFNNLLSANAGEDQIICSDETLLSASVPLDGSISSRWIVLQGDCSFDDTYSPSALISNIRQGENRLLWELNQNGCISIDEVTIINNLPTQATVGSNQMICSSEIALTGNTPTIGIGEWSLVNGAGLFDDVNNPTTTVRNLSQGTNTVRWTTSHNGCTSYADLSIENLKVDVNAGADQNICGRITTLDAESPIIGTGEWGVVPGLGGGTFLDRSDSSSKVGGLNNGANGFIWKVDNEGCISEDVVIINNNTPYPVDAGIDKIIFEATTFLNATSVTAGVGEWSIMSGSGTIEDVFNPFSQVSDLQRGENVFRWTVANLGCTEYDDVIITNGETIDADAGLDQVVCEDNTTLSANSPDVGVGEWSIVSGSGKIESIHDQNTRVFNLGPGSNIFQWTIYYTNRSSSDEVTITNSKPSQANAGIDRVIQGGTTSFNATLPMYGVGMWSLISGGGIIENINDHLSKVENLNIGQNTFRWTVANDYCSSSDDVIITNSTPTNIGDNNQVQSKLKIYPVPMEEILNIELEKGSIIESITIFNTTGKSIWQKAKVQSRVHQVNTNQFESGIYLIKVIDQTKQLYQSKVIKL